MQLHQQRRPWPPRRMMPMMVAPMMLMLGILVVLFLVWPRLSRIEKRLTQNER
jgi:hypothetical protein